MCVSSSTPNELHQVTCIQGLPYKFVAAPDSKGFSEAPPAILDALNHLTWAGQDAIQDGSYKPFNELLCLGYMENQKIGVSPSVSRIASLCLSYRRTLDARRR